MQAAATTLKASSDFQRLSRLGKKWTTPSFVMLALARDDAYLPARLGLTVSRKVGNAVVRNRTKRRLRAMAHDTCAVLHGFDIILIARAMEAERDMALLREDFLQGLKKLGVLA